MKIYFLCVLIIDYELLIIMELINDYSNIPSSILGKITSTLHKQPNHPICIMKNYIYNHTCFKDIEKFEDFDPIVSIEDNFDKLLILKNHPSRTKSDTYYVNETHVLRTHTSAHQNKLFETKHENYLVTGPVFRKDKIDRHHYPVFHQLEGVIKIDNDTDLYVNLDSLIRYLFPDVRYKIKKDYFPFTEPSYEVEILHEGQWIEILGCGIVHETILKNNSLSGKYLAFGIGLERLCMIFFNIPDIRYFWSNDTKFNEQFTAGSITKFKSYSVLPSQSADLSFWIDSTQVIVDNNDKHVWLQENDFSDLIRNQYPSWIESVELKDAFIHPKTQRHSRIYRIIFSPDSSVMTNSAEFTALRIEMSNNLINKIKESELLIELR